MTKATGAAPKQGDTTGKDAEQGRRNAIVAAELKSQKKEPELNVEELDEGLDDDGDSFISPDEFRAFLHRVNDLGLRWTADLPPEIKAENWQLEEVFNDGEFQVIENDFHQFLDELGHILWCVITKSDPSYDIVGSKDAFEEKAQIVSELIITPEFRSEFFFKQMLKVSYFLDLDWEVVIKASERGVPNGPVYSYALVSLLLMQNNIHADSTRNHVFAMDEQRIDILMEILGEMRAALQKSVRMAESLNEPL